MCKPSIRLSSGTNWRVAYSLKSLWASAILSNDVLRRLCIHTSTLLVQAVSSMLLARYISFRDACFNVLYTLPTTSYLTVSILASVGIAHDLVYYAVLFIACLSRLRSLYTGSSYSPCSVWTTNTFNVPSSLQLARCFRCVSLFMLQANWWMWSVCACLGSNDNFSMLTMLFGTVVTYSALMLRTCFQSGVEDDEYMSISPVSRPIAKICLRRARWTAYSQKDCHDLLVLVCCKCDCRSCLW